MEACSPQDAATLSHGRSWTSVSVRRIRWTRTSSVVLLAAVAAVISYGHMFALAVRHGETWWTSALIPLSVDGMVVASSMSILLSSEGRKRGELLPWMLLIVGSLASLAANVAVAEPSLVGRMVAAWPLFAFVGAYHLLQGQLRLHLDDESDTTSEYGVEKASADPEPSPLQQVCDSAPDLSCLSRQLQRQAWAWALANRSEDDQLPAGAVIARRFNRSPRWGRLVKSVGRVGELGVG
jgi:hypothetical protein